jgi:hypothetical protein
MSRPTSVGSRRYLAIYFFVKSPLHIWFESSDFFREQLSEFVLQQVTNVIDGHVGRIRPTPALIWFV